jgi:hypothetical protein
MSIIIYERKRFIAKQKFTEFIHYYKKIQSINKKKS